MVVQAGTINVNSRRGVGDDRDAGGHRVRRHDGVQRAAASGLAHAFGGDSGADGTMGQYLLTKSASVSSTSTLDLTSNDLIVDYSGSSPLASIKASIKTGFNNGSWDGKGIITLSGQTNPRTALGYAEASALLGLSGTAKGTFDGQSVDATTADREVHLLRRHRLVRHVTLDDFTQFLDGYLHGGNDVATGDFDYCGTVTLDDFTQFLDGYQHQGAPLGSLASPIASAPIALAPPTANDARRGRSGSRAGGLSGDGPRRLQCDMPASPHAGLIPHTSHVYKATAAEHDARHEGQAAARRGGVGARRRRRAVSGVGLGAQGRSRRVPGRRR